MKILFPRLRFGKHAMQLLDVPRKLQQRAKTCVPVRERQSLDSPKIIVEFLGVTPLPGEISYISQILKPQLLHKNIFANFGL